MSWYRIYRPQTVRSLHITPVREAFEHILNVGEFSHAYLLTGPKGTGKTSGARILAKVLNCETNRQKIEALISGTRGDKKKETKSLDEPCNKCAACIGITNGSSLCVAEVDGASNRRIDDVRDLTAKIGLSPSDGAINVVIIDEVHMLTTEAFNALLKVLEEPPAHVVFILATTDLQKMPATVVSRCQVIQYRKAIPEEISVALTQIADKEGIAIDSNALMEIITAADGSFRDAVKAFEQIAKGQSEVTVDDVSRTLGKSLRDVSETLLQKLAKWDTTAVADLFSKLTAEGTDLLVLQKEVLRSLHERLVLAPQQNNPHFPTYLALLKALNMPPSLSLPLPGLPFEIACLEWCLKNTKVFKSPAIPKVMASVMDSKEQIQTEDLRKKKDEIEAKIDVVPIVTTIDFSTILNSWHEVLRAVREKNPSVEALLKTTKPLRVESPNRLFLEVGYKFHKEQLETVRNYSLITEVLSNRFASELKPYFVLGEKARAQAKTTDSNLSGIVDLSFIKAAEEAFLS